jgi:hypothetical protein
MGGGGTGVGGGLLLHFRFPQTQVASVNPTPRAPSSRHSWVRVQKADAN